MKDASSHKVRISELTRKEYEEVLSFFYTNEMKGTLKMQQYVSILQYANKVQQSPLFLFSFSIV